MSDHYKRRWDGGDDDRHYRPNKKPYLDQGHRQPGHRDDRRSQGIGRFSGERGRTPLPARLPDLPPVSEEYRTAPFTHRSAANESRSVSDVKHVTYERLEFLGDAWLEVFASKIIFKRFIHLPAGQMSQLRELLVKNETLSDFTRAYGFDTRVSVVDLDQMKYDAGQRGNKGINKVLGDVFEAYIAAIVLSDDDEAKGQATAEKWCAALWEPTLQNAIKSDHSYKPDFSSTENDGDPRKKFNPEAKVLLQKRILGGGLNAPKLSYEPYKDSVELKGNKLGQNRHYIALYLTGYGYERKLLGKGEGKNKVEAGNWAAIEAMHGDAKDIVDECERVLKEEKQKRLAEKKANEGREEETKQDGRT